MKKQSIVSGRGSIVPTLIIIVVAVLFYYDGLSVYFSGGVWWNFWTVEELRSNFYFSSDVVRPVTIAIHDLISVVFGRDNLLPLHASLLGLHIANSILVFLILKKVMNGLVGLYSALLFTSFFAHPEVVTNPFGLCEAIRATFLLSCIILFYRYRRNPTQTNYVLTLGAFILAVGSRETTVLILLPLMYLVDRYLQIESETKGVRLNKGVYIPFIIISIAWLSLIMVAATHLHINWAEFPINLYLSAITSFNICLLKGPGYGTLILALCLVLSCLPLSDRKIRRGIILLWVGWLVTITPFIPLGMYLKYMYITSAFSMAILATCVYYLIVYLVERLRLKEVYVTFLTILFISIFVSTNFLYVSRHVEYFKDIGRVCESLVKHMLANFPKGTLGTELVFINFPYIYEPAQGCYIGARHVIWGDLFFMLASLYGRNNVGPTYSFTLSELYDGRHPLGLNTPKISPQEFEKLSTKKGTKVYLFNPKNDTILDVTGRDYNSLKNFISNNLDL